MTDLVITAGPFKFQARFETGLAPRTCEIFRRLLPYRQDGRDACLGARW